MNALPTLNVSWSSPPVAIAAAIALNLPFLLGSPERPFVETPLLRTLIINAVLFVAPGLPMVSLLIRRGWPLSFFWLWVVFFSFATFAAVVVVTRLLGMPAGATGIWRCTWTVVNLALLGNLLDRTRATKGPRFDPVRGVMWLLAFGLAYHAFFYSATRIVPAIGDQDDEIQGTAYGLVTRLKPTLTTSRNTEHLFAHPPMINIFVAGSILYYGAIDEFAVYDSQSPGHLDVDGIYERYIKQPYLLETRTPNIFLGALTTALLCQWIARMTGSLWLAGLSAAAYVTTPDVFVRSAYGGYFTISNFFLLQMLMASDAWQAKRPGDRRSGVLAGALAAIADHKTMLLPGAILMWNSCRTLKRWHWAAPFRAARHPVVVGFLLGTAAFWIYGLSISPHDFWMDHVRHHLVDRVLNNNARGLDMTKYPSVAGLWLEFWRHTSYLLLPGGLVALAVLSAGGPSTGQSDESGARGWRGTSGLWAVWVVATALAFSIIDWRQTKHLAPLTLPLFLALARVGTRGRARAAVAVLLLALVALNLRTLALLAADFTSLPTVPEW